MAEIPFSDHRHLCIRILSCLFLVVCSGALNSPSALAQPASQITIAAAADLNDPLQELAKAFESNTGSHLTIVLGSSGNLCTQIKNGAPFDLFLSADMDYPQKLVAEGHAEAETLFQYATGKLVVAAKPGVPVHTTDLASFLKGPVVQRIAIANPAHAPYGRAAVETLKRMGIYDQIKSKLVVGENVAQAAQFIESGAAQVGFVALSRVLSPGTGARLAYVPVPLDVYSPIRQGAVVLRRASGNSTAHEFLRFLRSREALSILRRYGFTS